MAEMSRSAHTYGELGEGEGRIRSKGSSEEIGGDSPISDTMVELHTPVAPDGGWGWMVAIGYLIINILIGMSVVSHALIYLQVIQRFQTTAAEAAWTGAIYLSAVTLIGPLATFLERRFSCRSVTFVGGLINAAGWCLGSFATNVYHLYLTTGLMAGTGTALGFVPGTVMVSSYFNKKQALALSLGTTGYGLGFLIFGPLTQYFLDEYGFLGTVLILGALSLHQCFSGAVFRPLSHPANRVKDRTITISLKQMESPLISRNDHEALPKSISKHSKIQHPVKVEQQNCDEINGVYSVIDDHASNEIDDLSVKLTGSDNIVKTPSGSADHTKGVASYSTLVRTSRFWVFCLGFSFYFFAIASGEVLIPALIEEKGIHEFQRSIILSANGAADILILLLGGLLLDWKIFKNHRIHLFCVFMLIEGAALGALALSSGFPALLVFGTIQGGFKNHLWSQQAVIITDVFGVAHLSNMFGLAMTGEGICGLLGPPVAGFLRDACGNYSVSLGAMAGLIIALMAIMLAFTCIIGIKPQAGMDKRLDSEDTDA